MSSIPGPNAVLLWIAGCGDEARGIAAEEGAGGDVRDALSALRRRITDQAMPSLVVEDVATARVRGEY